jgi:hypothetical protein
MANKDETPRRVIQGAIALLGFILLGLDTLDRFRDDEEDPN